MRSKYNINDIRQQISLHFRDKLRVKCNNITFKVNPKTAELGPFDVFFGGLCDCIQIVGVDQGSTYPCHAPFACAATNVDFQLKLSKPSVKSTPAVPVWISLPRSTTLPLTGANGF